MSSNLPPRSPSRPAPPAAPPPDRVHWVVWIGGVVVVCAFGTAILWSTPEPASMMLGEKSRTPATPDFPNADRARVALPQPAANPAIEAGDFERLLAAALAKTDDAGRRGALRALAAQVTARNPEDALRMLGQIDGAGDRAVFAAELGFQWTRLDATAAVNALARWPDADFRESLVGGVARAFASENPQAAAEWIARLAEPGLQAAAVQGACAELLCGNPVRAQRWVEALPAGAARDAGIARVAAARLRTEPQATLRWLNEAPLNDTRLQNELVFDALAQLAASNPTAAGAWIAQLPAGPERAEATALYAESLMTSDPAEAARMALTLPASADADAHAATALAHWLAVDPVHARAFLAAQRRAGDAAARERLASLLTEAEASREAAE